MKRSRGSWRAGLRAGTHTFYLEPGVSFICFSFSDSQTYCDVIQEAAAQLLIYLLMKMTFASAHPLETATTILDCATFPGLPALVVVSPTLSSFEPDGAFLNALEVLPGQDLPTCSD